MWAGGMFCFGVFSCSFKGKEGKGKGGEGFVMGT